MDYHDRHRVGDLMSRIANDSEAINQILSNGLIQFTTNILSLGGIMVAMLLLNLPLAAGTLIILPVMLFITKLVTERTRRAFRGMQKNLGWLNAVMEETSRASALCKPMPRKGWPSPNSSGPAKPTEKLASAPISSRLRWDRCSPP